MQIPAGSKKYDHASGKVVFALTGHTSTKPRLVTLVRSLPNKDGFARTELKVTYGVTDSEGVVNNLFATLSIRSVPGQVLADVTAAMNAIRTIAGSTGFDNEFGITQILPDSSDIAP